jgi:hypothetical protein
MKIAFARLTVMAILRITSRIDMVSLQSTHEDGS